MPIKPENKKLYPKNWKQIRAAILERAGHKCERCGIPNHVYGFRVQTGPKKARGEFIQIEDPEKGKRLHGKKVTFGRFGCNLVIMCCLGAKIIRIILTIAHLDHDPTNNDPDNLAALCQRCHNKHDAKHRAETRRESQR